MDLAHQVTNMRPFLLKTNRSKWEAYYDRLPVWTGAFGFLLILLGQNCAVSCSPSCITYSCFQTA